MKRKSRKSCWNFSLKYEKCHKKATRIVKNVVKITEIAMKIDKNCTEMVKK